MESVDELCCMPINVLLSMSPQDSPEVSHGSPQPISSVSLLWQAAFFYQRHSEGVAMHQVGV